MENKSKKKKTHISDKKQILILIFFSISEIFKIVMATLLILFVPQKCEEDLCTMEQIINNYDGFTKFVLYYNFITLGVFLIFYFVEIRREIFLIKYLDIDNTLPDNNLPRLITNYPKVDKKLDKTNKNYYYIVNSMIFMVVVNFIISLICVFFNYADFKSLTSILSFTALTTSKVYNSYYISTNAMKNDIFLSAYMTEYSSFNVMDNDYIKKIKKIKNDLSAEFNLIEEEPEININI